jgi:hypothetical protein
VSVGGGGGHSPLLGDTFHGPNGIIGKNDGQRFNEGLEEANDDLKLAQCHVVVVEGCQEEYVFSGK